LALLWVLLLLVKLLFILLNRQSFSGLSFLQVPGILLAGLRFDLVMITYLNGLFILLHILPFPFRDQRIYQSILKFIFLLINIPVMLIELTDIAYFPFNNKRMTSDVAGVAGAGIRNALSFAIDYWYLLLTGILIIYILIHYYPKWDKKRTPIKYNFLLQLSLFLIGAALSVVGARGGLQTIPVTPANAAQFTDVRYAPLVLNSTYSIMYSVLNPGVAEKLYMTEMQVNSLLQKQAVYSGRADRPNIMIIILESYASEYIGYYNNGIGYTPFTDSLLKHSLVFTNGFANAERSNKSLCALLGGLPSILDDAFVNTIYSANCFKGIGTYLKGTGYYTSFFHGGINGEFKFDSFTSAAGFDHYYGKNEFGNDKYFDGNWGIYDHYFFNYTADVLNEQPQPFCSAIFSISAHHPFNVPAELKSEIPDGDKVIHEAIGYTDYALKSFFKKASVMPWFKNTVFIITADHTFGYGEHPAIYSNAAGSYRVPIAIFKGDGSIINENDSTLSQHLDILPTVLDISNYKGTANTYGKSLLRKIAPRYVIQLKNNIYQIIDERYILFFDGKTSVGLYDYVNDVSLEYNLLPNLTLKRIDMENYGKALIQDYFHSLNKNTLCN
jgi:phosphoglycerol transferase MdoB-like AlkP superfamily enzyme